jgi:hypothetical protein
LLSGCCPSGLPHFRKCYKPKAQSQVGAAPRSDDLLRTLRGLHYFRKCRKAEAQAVKVAANRRFPSAAGRANHESRVPQNTFAPAGTANGIARLRPRWLTRSGFMKAGNKGTRLAEAQARPWPAARAFLLQIYAGASAAKWRFQQEIATLLKICKGYT